MSKSHLLKYLLISPNLPVGGFCYSEGLESYLNTKDLKDSNSVKELIISELKIGQIRLDARLLLDFFDIFNELNDGKNLKYNMQNITEDFFLPVRGGDSGTNIESLPGLTYEATEDIEYLKNKLLSAVINALLALFSEIDLLNCI